MEVLEKFNYAKETEEIEDVVEKYCKLQAQINNPTRFGMIDALSDAQKVAFQEITILENSQGDIYPMPWSYVSDRYLFRKLPQYQKGLYIHAVKKFGEEKFKKLLNERAEESKNK